MKWDRLLLPHKYLYTRTKLFYASTITSKKFHAGEISDGHPFATWWKEFSKGKMTFLYRNEGHEMAPTIPGKHETLLIRNLPCPNPEHRLEFRQVSVGDVVLLKNPLDSNKCLVRRLAALGGQEMESTDEKDEPFEIDEYHCWVLSDNQELKVKEANDSRTFGPVPIMDIMGRVIYRFQSMKDHGFVKNSDWILKEDIAVAQYELELNDMQKISEA